jgi:hypothetical protein
MARSVKVLGLAAVAALAALGACVKMDRNPPKDLPPYVKLYPGAQPMATMGMGPLSTEMETTSDSAETVMAFYRGQAAADGLTEKPVSAQANAAPGQMQTQFGDATGDKMLIVLTRPQNGATLLSLTYRPAKAPTS